MADKFAVNIEVQTGDRGFIIDAVKHVLADGNPSTVITQDLKDYTRVLDKQSGTTIKVGYEENPVTVHLGEASEDDRLELMSRLGEDKVRVVDTLAEDKPDGYYQRDAGEQVRSSRGHVDSEAEMSPTGELKHSEEVYKPISKGEAQFVEPGDVDFDSTHPSCKDCAHYDDHGNCRIVPDINDDGYCMNHYADAGFFVDGGGLGGAAGLVTTFWGNKAKKRLEGGAALKSVQDIKNKISDYVGDAATNFMD